MKKTIPMLSVGVWGLTAIVECPQFTIVMDATETGTITEISPY